MDTIHAVFEGGVFRPIQPVMMPEKSEVELRIVSTTPKVEVEPSGDMDAIYAILSHRYNTGISDLAARHNEHQP